MKYGKLTQKQTDETVGPFLEKDLQDALHKVQTLNRQYGKERIGWAPFFIECFVKGGAIRYKSQPK